MEYPKLLQQWVSATLSEEPLCGRFSVLGENVRLSKLEGDAGFRQYYRVNTTPESLVVYAPQQSSKSESAIYFSELSQLLHRQDVPTPLIYACDEMNNRLLIESFGRTDLLDVLTSKSVDGYYSIALSVLLRVQQVPSSTIKLPKYDQSLLSQEMSLFPEWFVEKMLGYQLSVAEREMFGQLTGSLAQQALEQPQVFVHRDYHSRNLMYRDSGELGVIDFQDAVYGPITYDLVSLLKDCYVRWSPEDVQQWAIDYMHMASKAGVMQEVSPKQFLQWFDLMGLQRHIKVLGIFARLSLRDGKDRYLNDLPLVMRYTLETAKKYPQTQAFAQWFEQVLLPKVMAQPWYRDYKTAGDV
jgi:aminoglycoside/choline kinase family phosphotransferase